MTDEYPPIENHGLIGDLQTAALVADDGTIDWFCAPRFDSPSIFAALVDSQRGGHFRISAERTEFVTRQLYLPGTPILITRFVSVDGVGEVIDFMPIAGDTATRQHTIVRLLRVVRGEVAFLVDCQPRFNYGRDEHETEVGEHGVTFRSRDLTVNLTAARRGGPFDTHDIRRVDGGVQEKVVMRAGDAGGLLLETAPHGPPRSVPVGRVTEMFHRTRDYWRGWLGRSHYAGRWRETVERSAMTLKLMTYAPTGALVAAPTTSLPEQIGGERNWDYRYTWIRDASFSVYSLLSLGFTEEASAFLSWLNDRIRDASERSRPLQIMYCVDGDPDLTEVTLDHLAGYRGSRPVRVGNGAATQSQLDIYGEALDSIYQADLHAIQMNHDSWQQTARMIDWLCENWDAPDDGIWETRGGRENFVYGKVMSWVAFDRGIRLSQRRGRPADVGRWTNMRDMVYRQVMERGFHKERGAFVQHYGSEVLDASLLYLPLIGFVAPTDPMWHSTLAAMDQELVSDSLVYRYNPSASPDGLRGSEGTFSMCTFWYVDALARSGRLNEARLVFEKMQTYANHLGLYAEEIGPTGEQLGNFPQAFSHLALISAAVNLDYQLDHGAGWVDPVVVRK